MIIRHASFIALWVAVGLQLSGCVGSQSPIVNGGEPDPHFRGEFLVFAHEASGKCDHPQTQPAPKTSASDVYCEIGSLSEANGDGWKRLTTKVAAPPGMAGASIDIRLLGDGTRSSIAELRMRTANQQSYLYGAVLPFSGDDRLRVAAPILCEGVVPQSGILARDSTSCVVSAEALQQTAAEAKDLPAFHFVLVPVVDGRSVLATDAKPGERGSPEYEETRQRLLNAGNAALDHLEAERACLIFEGLANCQVYQGRAVLKMKHQDGFYLPDGTVLGTAEWPK